jgi:hypothetical protein
MTCNDAYESIVRTIDDARLTGDERTALRRHLMSCARCRGEYETQHEVRRLLVLHIQDQLPAGFDARLSARLAQTPRALPPGPVRATPPPSTMLRWPQVEDDCRRGLRGRTWALRLVPLAATLALIAAGTFVRDNAPPVGSAASSDTLPGVQSPGPPRAFTTAVVRRHDGASPRRDRRSSVSTHDGALAPPPVDGGHPHGPGAVADAGRAVEDAPGAARAAKEEPGTAGVNERVSVSASSGQERERVARRERGSGRERDAHGERDADAERDADGERAVSQRPGILPRPPTPFPLARPAMPAPPAMPSDRSIPPP